MANSEIIVEIRHNENPKPSSSCEENIKSLIIPPACCRLNACDNIICSSVYKINKTYILSLWKGKQRPKIIQSKSHHCLFIIIILVFLVFNSTSSKNLNFTLSSSMYGHRFLASDNPSTADIFQKYYDSYFNSHNRHSWQVGRNSDTSM